MFLDINNNKLNPGDLILVKLPVDYEDKKSAYALFVDDNTIFSYLGLQKDRNQNILCYKINELSLSNDELLIKNHLISEYQKYVINKANKLNEKVENYLPGTILQFDGDFWPPYKVYLGRVQLLNLKTNECFEGFCYFNIFEDLDDGIKSLDAIYADIHGSLDDEFYERKTKKLFECNMFEIRAKFINKDVVSLGEIDIGFFNNEIIRIYRKASRNGKEPFKLILK